MYQSSILEKNFTIVPGRWSQLLTNYFDIEPTPPLMLCWKLTAEKIDGRIFELNGDGPYPKVIDVPDTVVIDSIILIDEGIEIDKSEYRINII